MSTKGYKGAPGRRSSYIDLDKLESYGVFDNAKPTDPSKFGSYNEYTADQVSKFPEILLAFMQYEGGDDAMYYLQLIWMDDFYKSKKNMVV